MSYVLDVISKSIAIIFAVIGVFFFLVGTVGVFRLPDFYARTHAATKCDTLGVGAILFGLAIYEKFSFDAFKIIIIAFLVFISSPTAAHALSRAAFRRGLIPWQKEVPLVIEEE